MPQAGGRHNCRRTRESVVTPEPNIANSTFKASPPYPHEPPRFILQNRISWNWHASQTIFSPIVGSLRKIDRQLLQEAQEFLLQMEVGADIFVTQFPELFSAMASKWELFKARWQEQRHGGDDCEAEECEGGVLDLRDFCMCWHFQWLHWFSMDAPRIGGSCRHYWDFFSGVLLLDVWQRHCSSGHNVHCVGSAEGQYSW